MDVLLYVTASRKSSKKCRKARMAPLLWATPKPPQELPICAGNMQLAKSFFADFAAKVRSFA